MDPTQLLLGASVRGWSLGGGWGRKPNHDVSPKNPTKGTNDVLTGVDFSTLLVGTELSER